jgi:hypothetical protein
VLIYFALSTFNALGGEWRWSGDGGSESLQLGVVVVVTRMRGGGGEKKKNGDAGSIR